jgi:signal transduction histidine kinase
MLVGDRKQLQQVLWNIMLNGMQAMGSGGVLTVSLERREPFAVITIADTGVGIAPDQIERIFKPFFTTKHKGTGLGMTICSRIVEQHGGSLALASSPGEGTRVTIQLPLKQNS